MASGNGLIIVDLTWATTTVPQVTHPVTIHGKPYLVEVDEYSATEDGSITVWPDGSEGLGCRRGPR